MCSHGTRLLFVRCTLASNRRMTVVEEKVLGPMQKVRTAELTFSASLLYMRNDLG